MKLKCVKVQIEQKTSERVRDKINEQVHHCVRGRAWDQFREFLAIGLAIGARIWGQVIET